MAHINIPTILGCDILSLLENMFFTSIIYDFLHWFLTDVESNHVESIIVNIDFLKLMLT